MDNNVELSVLALACRFKDVFKYMLQLGISENSFQMAQNKTIYIGYKECFDKFNDVDLVLVANILKDKKVKISDEFLNVLKNGAVADIDSLNEYVNYLKEVETKKSITDNISKISMLKSSELNSMELVEQIGKIYKEMNTTDSSVKSVKEKNVINDFRNFIFNTKNFSDDVTLTWGMGSDKFDDYNPFLTGLLVFAAPPGWGKTVVGMTAAIKSAENGAKVSFVSAELNLNQLMARRISSEIGISQKDLLSGKWKISKDEMDRRIKRVTDDFLTDNLSFITGVTDVESICAKIKRDYFNEKIDLLVIDYIQILTSKQKFKSDWETIAFVCAQLHALSIELNLPIVCLSQVSREFEKENRKPYMGDLAGGSAIEKYATSITVIGKNLSTDQPGFTEETTGAYGSKFVQFIKRNTFYNIKNRYGQQLELHMLFRGAESRFEEDFMYTSEFTKEVKKPTTNNELNFIFEARGK